MLKNIKLFTNHSAYEAAKNNIDKPNVVLCAQENEVHYNPVSYYAVTTGGTNRFAAGYLVNKVWHVYFSNNNKAWGIDNTGLIVNEMGGMDGLIPGFMLPKMRDSGIEVESYVQEVVDWNVGETIPNVEQYTFIIS